MLEAVREGMARHEFVDRQPEETDAEFADRRLRFPGYLPGETDQELLQRQEARHDAYIRKMHASIQDLDTRLQAVERKMKEVDFDGLYAQHLDLRVHRHDVQQRLDRAIRG